MVSKLEEVMKKEGWILGYTEHCNVKYWSFRKKGFEIPIDNISMVCPLDNEDHKNFKGWREEI